MDIDKVPSNGRRALGFEDLRPILQVIVIIVAATIGVYQVTGTVNGITIRIEQLVETVKELKSDFSKFTADHEIRIRTLEKEGEQRLWRIERLEREGGVESVK